LLGTNELLEHNDNVSLVSVRFVLKHFYEMNHYGHSLQGTSTTNLIYHDDDENNNNNKNNNNCSRNVHFDLTLIMKSKLKWYKAIS
jgi:hypothetical protein